jgi:UDPglucose 6-dehydrogenase
MRVSVIGTGYLGAVHATGMAALGHDVIGVDSDAQKIGMLQRGQSPFFEPGFPELLEQMVDSGSLRFSTDIQDAAQFAEVHFICVGTPQLPDSNNADLTQIELVVDLLLKDISPTAIIVGKSTVPVGTAASLRKRIVDRLPFGPALAWNPEFLREGFAVADTLTPDRIVFGVTDDRCEAVLRTLYAPILERGTPCIVTDLASAELVKVSANSFLATKISFINAVAEVCEAAGADVTTVARAIGLDERIGSRFLNAGIGFGGGCLGKDIRAFGAQADLLGVPSVRDLLKEIDAINNTARQRMVGLAIELLGGTVAGRRITILGAAFKPTVTISETHLHSTLLADSTTWERSSTSTIPRR